MRTWALAVLACFLLAEGGCARGPGKPADSSDSLAAPSGKIASRAAAAEAGASADAPAPGGRAALKSAGLDELLLYAALNNPGMEAAFFHWKAALERIPQVRALPDPKFTYAYYFREVETRVGPQHQSLALAQTFPWFGKLDLRGGAAAEEAGALRRQFQAEKLKVYFQVKKAWFEYYYLGQAVRVTRENLQLLQQTERLARTRYKAAAASHPDVIRLQVELGKLEDRLATLTELRAPVLARLSAAVGVAGVPLDLPWPESIPHRPTKATWQELVRQTAGANPALRAMDHKTAAARRREALARKDYYPDVTVGVTYIDTGGRTGPMAPSDSGQDAVIGMVSLNIPLWWDKLAAGVREARLRRMASQRARQQLANDLTTGVRQLLYELQDAQRKIDLYQGTLLPKAREALQVTLAGFVAGKSSFTDLIDAQRVLLDFELSHRRALADHAIRRAAVEQIVGGELPGPASPPAKEGPVPQRSTNPSGPAKPG